MTQAADDVRGPILEAVQAALTGFGEQVKTEIVALREALAVERAARVAAESQVAGIAAALESSNEQAQARHVEVNEHVDAAVGAVRTTLDERLEALESWSDASTDAANELEARLSATEARAARLAEDVTSRLSTRVEATDAATAGLIAGHASMTARLDASETRVDSELEALRAAVEPRIGADAPVTEAQLGERLAEAQQQVDAQVTAAHEQVAARVTAAERQVADQLDAAERRIGEDVRVRLAEVDEEFERMADGVEGSVTALNERANDIDGRLGDLIQRVTALEAVVSEIDVDVIDELSERVSAAAGEAVLVRIETERFQESVNETNDKMARRVAEVESQLQAQEMDVESAVQLERLEEIERALIELDPSQFVRVDGDASGSSRSRTEPSQVPIVGSNGETGRHVTGRTDQPKPPKPTLPTSSG